MTIWSSIIAASVGIIMGLFIVSRKNIDHSAIHVINRDDFVGNMRKGQLIDVRKKDEFDQNKIKGARNFTPSQITGKGTKLRKDQSVYLYCKNGKKSHRTAKKMTKQGYKNIYILEKGFENY
ncbi:MAG: rhodanese-like domain-containing protein [Candidatus Izimaplasma sp.]|nr:rhodanese-like domain-containing protein [Candidatus Izimaplasma bacterium]